MLTGMLAGTSASSLRVQITRLAWLLQEQAAGHEVAGGEPPAAAEVKATPPPPAPRGGEKSQRKSRAPWGQDILPGGSGGHGEPWACAILNGHALRGRRELSGGEKESLGEGQGLGGPAASQHLALCCPATIVTSLLRAPDSRGSLAWAPLEGQAVPEAVTHQAEPAPEGPAPPPALVSALCWETAGPLGRTEN